MKKVEAPTVPKCLLCATPVTEPVHASVSDGLLCYRCTTNPLVHSKASDRLRIEVAVRSAFALVETAARLENEIRTLRRRGRIAWVVSAIFGSAVTLVSLLVHR